MSQFFLGEINYKCIKDINYFQLASDQNHVGAQIILGNIFYNGEFIEKDIDISIHFFQLAANQDDTEALYMLGVIYSDENESYFDINQSLHYFQLAAIKGHDLSINKVITLNIY